jgi:hypothetical protein
MKITKGPWEYTLVERKNRKFISIHQEGFNVNDNDGERGFSSVAGIWDISGESIANAKLISSAPEMLDALKSVNNYFVNLQNKCALTPSDERTWKIVSGIISDIEE